MPPTILAIEDGTVHDNTGDEQSEGEGTADDVEDINNNDEDVKSQIKQ